MRSWSMEAAVELRRLQDELRAVADRLGAADAESWVSPAADGYRRELALQQSRVSRLVTRAEEARVAVLAHTNAADDWTRVDR